MIYTIYKLFIKLSSSFRVILINILFASMLFLYSESAFSQETNIERNIAYKYCDSLEKNLFKGLDNEKILKYEYLFNSINKEELYKNLDEISKFTSEVESICSYKLSKREKKDIKKFINNFLSSNK